MAVGDALISKVIDLLTGAIEKKFNLLVGVEDEIKLLTNNLHSIKAVLNVAEKRQLQNEAIKVWLDRLKVITYAIDDVLDECNTEVLKSQIEGDGYEYATPEPKRRKVWSSVSSFSSREVGFRHNIADKIRKLNESLDVIAKEKDRYSFQLIEGNEKVERAMTTSFVNIPEVKGREQDENAVIDLLMAESKQNPHIISLVGMGGIGKTTLAKLVYNKRRVETHFENKIWVCVSDPFDEIRIAKAILESLKGSPTTLVEMQNIVREIHRYIKEKTFLLVLDDVWNEDFRKWEQLEHFLRCGSSGSKILVTTRKKNVAKIMGCKDIIPLKLLSDEECWSMFSQIVFSERMKEESLEKIGRKIVVDRCKGLPLTVKTIGGLLRSKDYIEEWQSVLDNELWEVEEVDVLAPLQLSYYDLSSPLKQCFLYCVIFPKDYVMSKKKLIGMWMSQGYLKATKNKDMEMIGDEYFQNLAMRSFFQDFEADEWDGSNIYFKMHDIVHDFGISLMKNECCSTEVNSPTEQNIEFSTEEINMHHLGIMLGVEVSFPSSVYALRSLRSLVLIRSGHSKITAALPNIFNELTCLRSLSLRSCCIREIPSNISNLLHLRELDLSDNTRLKELPETVCKLYNLQALDVGRSWCLERLPRGIGKLVSLRCLYNSGCDWLLLPKEIGRLSGLRRLNLLRIRDDDEEEGLMSRRDLENLNLLGGYLHILWERQHVADVDVKDAKQSQLKKKKHLAHLVLSFSVKVGAEWRKGGGGDEELLEALEPSPCLKFLQIYNYKGTKLRDPSWIKSLTFLRKLILNAWHNIEEMPPLGKLPSLESLELRGLQKVKKVKVEFLGIDETTTTAFTSFPRLINLEFQEMWAWEEWNYGEIIIMPSLRSLTLKDCPKLKALPDFILQNTSLELKIENCYKLQPH